MQISRHIAEACIELLKEESPEEVSSKLQRFVKQYNLGDFIPHVVAYLGKSEELQRMKETVVVESATPLSKEVRQTITKSLQAEDAKLEETQNKDLLAGFVATYDGIQYDASLQTLLTKLKNA